MLFLFWTSGEDCLRIQNQGAMSSSDLPLTVTNANLLVAIMAGLSIFILLFQVEAWIWHWTSNLSTLTLAFELPLSTEALTLGPMIKTKKFIWGGLGYLTYGLPAWPCQSPFTDIAKPWQRLHSFTLLFCVLLWVVCSCRQFISTSRFTLWERYVQSVPPIVGQVP